MEEEEEAEEMAEGRKSYGARTDPPRP
jgi:hypothetical protein